MCGYAFGWLHATAIAPSNEMHFELGVNILDKSWIENKTTKIDRKLSNEKETELNCCI